jgi:hypothetical protein
VEGRDCSYSRCLLPGLIPTLKCCHPQDKQLGQTGKKEAGQGVDEAVPVCRSVDLVSILSLEVPCD